MYKLAKIKNFTIIVRVIKYLEKKWNKMSTVGRSCESYLQPSHCRRGVVKVEFKKKDYFMTKNG